METALFWTLLVAGAVVLLAGPAWLGSRLAQSRLRRLLGEGEVVLRSARAVASRLSAETSLLSVLRSSFPLDGTLYLTDRRLIWRRNLFSPGPALLTIPLQSVRGCSVRGMGWVGASLRVEAAEASLVLYPFRSSWDLYGRLNTRFAEELAGAITAAREAAKLAGRPVTE